MRHGRIERELVLELEGSELAGFSPDGRWDDARAVFDRVALDDHFEEFLTLPAYDYLD